MAVFALFLPERTYLSEGKPRMSGNMAWMPEFGSTSTAPMPTPLPLSFFAATFIFGASCLQWPHQGA